MIITEAQVNRWVETVKKFMHMFQRIGNGQWYHSTKNKLYAFKYNKQTQVLTILIKNVKDNEQEVRRYYNDIMGLTDFMKSLTDMTGNLVESVLTEETVYDDSWYEVKGQKYPKKRKKGVKISENASCCATCAGNVATIPTVIGKPIKRKGKKNKRLDIEMFKESILNNEPCICKINGKMCKYIITEGSGFLYIGHSLVKTLSKNVMNETIDRFYNEEPLSVDLLENYSARELITLLNEDYETPQGTEAGEPLNPDEQEEVDQMDDDKDSVDYSIVDNDNESVITDQEYVGFDKENNLVTMKDKNNGEIRNVKVANIVKNED